MAIKAKGKDGANDKLPVHKEGKGKKASQATSPNKTDKSAKMGSSSESFGDSDVKAGFRKLPHVASAADVNQGAYINSPGSVQNDSKTISDMESKKK